jgi:hypothetical protein
MAYDLVASRRTMQMSASPIVGVAAPDLVSNRSADAVLRAEAAAVRDALAARGLETPFRDIHLGADEKRRRIQHHFAEIMKVLGLDLVDDSLADTPYVNGGFDTRTVWGFNFSVIGQPRF